MLDTLRRNVRKLSWTLWLVIIAFIVLYIPDLVRGPQNVVATVEDEPIYLDEFRESYQQQINYYRSLNQGELPDDFMQQVQLDRIVLEQLVRRKILLIAAQDQGLSWTPQEVRDRILQYDAFRDESGRFIGSQRYRQVLQRNGMEVDHFESHLIQDLLVEKLTNLVTDGVTITDREVEEAFQRRNENVRLSYLSLGPGAFRERVAGEITDDEVRSRFEEDPSAYRLPERRRISYAIVDTDEIRDSIDIGEERLRRAYQERTDEYTVQEQVHARHILFRVPPSAGDEQVEAARQEAEAVLEQLRAGGEFAELAREHSDDTTASAGGDLGWISRGRMVEEFDEVAFSLPEGEISEPVRTPFGFHLITVEGRREERARPFDEVRSQIEQSLAWERAEERAGEIAQEIRRAVLRGQELEAVVQEHGLDLRSSDPFPRSSGLEEISSPEFTRRVFEMAQGRVAEPVRIRRGYVVFRVDQILDPQAPDFEEVREEVRADLVEERARQRARQEAGGLVERLAGGADIESIAQEVGVEVRQTELITRDDPVGELGRAPALVQASFAKDTGEAGGPVEVQGSFVVFRVAEHVQPDWSRFAERRTALREELLDQRRNQVFEALVQQLRERYEVVVHQEILQQAVS